MLDHTGIAKNLEKEETVTDLQEQHSYSSNPHLSEAVVLNSVSSTKTLDKLCATETK